LNSENERRGESAHERKPVSRTNQQVNQRDRPGEKDQNLKKICQRTSSQRMTADRQKRRLKNKAESNREKIKSSWSKNSGAQSDPGMHDRREKTDCRNDEKIAIHSKETYCKSRPPAWQSVFSSL